MSKTTKTKTGSPKSARRREGVRRNLPKSPATLRSLLRRPELINVSLVLVGLLLAVSIVVLWSREQVKVRPGQLMTTTRLHRIDFTVRDDEATERAREAKRNSAPRIYRLNEAYLNSLDAALSGLPKAVAGKSALEDISPEIIAAFDLTPDGLVALNRMVQDGEPIAKWQRDVKRLIEQHLSEHPILESEEFQVYSLTPEDRRALKVSDDDLEKITEKQIEVAESGDAETDSRLMDLVVLAGFAQDVRPYVWHRLRHDLQPTMIFDQAATDENREKEAASVEDKFDEHRAGEIIYRAGDALSPEQYDLLTTEIEQFRANASFAQLWLPRAGAMGIIAILTAFLGLLIVTRYDRIMSNVLRAVTLCALLFATLLLTVGTMVPSPQWLYPAVMAPALFLTVVLTLAYDRRLAMLLAVYHAIVLTLAIEQGMGPFLIVTAGCCAMAGMLGEVRHRSTLVRASGVTAAVLAITTSMVGLWQMPSGATGAVLSQLVSGGMWSVIASFGVGFLVLGILPGLERLFDITTGMTLAELRDPKQPLLRQLQQRAPGTYNHSLQVANICEAAAEAIGADGLLVYVGAMYHDIGKMNKPMYFVENQAGGENRHEKLSPAMSLLVIIGHVKDGIELAREYNLPRRLHHFIESHHGTTLVEYFYHAAKTQAELDEKATPVSEVEYRYPGPRPQTKEAAILMLADTVESATRAMTEPNPSRIETLVRVMAQKKLMDGQFDECGLTFKELGQIQDAIISRVCAIHHGRIAYPTADAGDRGSDEAKAVRA